MTWQAYLAFSSSFHFSITVITIIWIYILLIISKATISFQGTDL